MFFDNPDYIKAHSFLINVHCPLIPSLRYQQDIWIHSYQLDIEKMTHNHFIITLCITTKINKYHLLDYYNILYYLLIQAD